MVAAVMLLSTAINAQIKNSKTEKVKVYGNCGMCETKIEKAGTIKKIASVDWNKDTQMATLTYDAKKKFHPITQKKRVAAVMKIQKIKTTKDVKAIAVTQNVVVLQRVQLLQ